jgi:hypothetical protein
MATNLTLNERIERISKKLTRMAAAYDERASLLTRGHENYSNPYRVNPCLEETVIARFENENQIQLPIDYRAFLL